MRKTNKVLIKIQANYEYLKTNQGLFWGDETYTQIQLINKYSEMRDAVIRYQIENLEGFMNWRCNRLEQIRVIFNETPEIFK